MIGAIVAAGVAWASIVAAAVLPLRLPARPLRWVGAGSLAGLALILMGVPLPDVAPLAFLAGGVAGIWLAAKEAGATAK